MKEMSRNTIEKIKIKQLTPEKTTIISLKNLNNVVLP